MHKLEIAAAFVLVGYHTVGMGGPFIAHSKSGKYLSNVLFGYLKQWRKIPLMLIHNYKL